MLKLTNRRTVWILLAVLTTAPGRAELVYFKQGGRVQLPATAAADGTVRLELPVGRPLIFATTDVRKLVPGHWPERELDERIRSAGAGVDGRLAVAWWALEHGLTPQAETLLRALHLADPSHAAAARMVATLDRLDGSGTRGDRELDSIYQALGGSFEAARGPHVLLLHQRTEAEASERLDLLERVVRSYYLYFAAQGIELRVPEHRLVAAWIGEQRDYLAFLHGEGADVFRTTLGYYHPTLQAVVTFDLRSLERQRTGDAAPENPRRSLLLEMQRQSMEQGTAAHEMVHLLVAESGLAPRHDDFPHWLHEGLAAQFEVVRGGRWAGFGRAHDLRLPDWRKIDPPARLVPLLRDAGLGRGYDRGTYAAAWALVYYLHQQHPLEFVTFLDLLRTRDPEVRPRPDRTVALFSTAFGADLHALEADWHRFMATVKTPLEEGQ
jgi:hypothetical protein